VVTRRRPYWVVSAQPLYGKGAPNLIEPRAVRAAVKAASRLTVALRPVLTAAVRGAVSVSQAGTEKRALKPNKETSPWQHEVLARFE
jgi:hypothetical protein